MSEHDWYREKEISRTSTGLTLLIVGLALGWIPYILYLGDLLIFIGAILVILGRGMFGYTHERSVNIAIVIFVISLIAAFAIAISFVSSIASNIHSSTLLKDTFRNYMLGLIIVGALSGLSYILLAYGISDNFGKRILYLGFILQIAVAIALYFAVMPSVYSAISSAISGNLAPLNAVEGRITLYGMLNAIPLLTFAFAYRLAKKRIDVGVIPA